MKKSILILTVIASAISFSSCKKCVSCTYNNEKGETMTAESCKKKSNEQLETDLEEQWGAYGTVVCTDQ